MASISWHRERITATNPCGAIPLRRTGPVISAAEARIDFQRLADAVQIAVRLLDNVIDVSQFRFQYWAEMRITHGASASASPGSPISSSCSASLTASPKSKIGLWYGRN